MKRVLTYISLTTLVVFCLFLYARVYIYNTAYAATGINRTINFQGKLVNADGTNVTNGAYSIVFSFYDVTSSGTALWSETQNVTVTDGIFRVALGASTPIPANFNFNWDGIYLGMKVESDSEMTPRIRMTAAPYAFNSEKVAGLTVLDENDVASTSGILKIPNGSTISFGSSFTTTPSNALTLTTTGLTNITLPTTGTLSTLAGTETLTNKSLTDSLNAFTDNGDPTKLLKFDVANVGAGTTLTLTLPASPGTSDTICLQTKANCASGGSGGPNYWTLNSNGTIYPVNATLDLLVGGVSTASAKVVLGASANASSFFNSGGNVGIGTSAPSALLHLTQSRTATSGFESMGYNEMTLDPSSGSSATEISVWNRAFTGSGNAQTLTGGIIGLYNEAIHQGTGTLALAYADQANIKLSNAGTITNATNVRISTEASAGTITDHYGIYIENPWVHGSGAMTTNYGLYLADQTAGSTDYAIYSGGGNSYFAGNIGIGQTNPSAYNLDVTGTARFTGAITVASCSGCGGGSGGSSNWTLNSNGTIYPINTTLDLLVGGVSTAAAKFVLGANGTLTANSGTAQYNSLYNFLRSGSYTDAPQSSSNFKTIITGGGGSATVPIGIVGSVDMSGGTVNHLVGVLGLTDDTYGTASTWIGTEGRSEANTNGDFVTGVKGLAVFDNATSTSSIAVGVIGQVDKNVGSGIGLVGVGGIFSIADGSMCVLCINAVFGSATTNYKTQFRGLINLAEANADFTIDDTSNKLVISTLDNVVGGVKLVLDDAAGSAELSIHDSGDVSVATIDSDGNADFEGTLISGTSNGFSVNATGNIIGLGGVAHSIANSAGALSIDSNSTGAINIGTSANAKTITMGNTTGATALTFNTGTGAQTHNSSVVSGTTTTSAFVYNANALTTGTGLYLGSTNTSFSSGTLAQIAYVPGSTPSTAPTGDLLRLSLGSNATNFLGNYFNILNTSSASILSVSDTQFTTSLPLNFTAPGDLSVAYDIAFTNPTASYIKSSAPLYFVAGEVFNSSNLTLQTYNYGSIVLETTTTGSTLIPNGNVGIGTTAPVYTLDVTGTARFTGAITVASCTGCGGGSGGSSNWTLNSNGTIYPINATLDLLVGGVSTASAKTVLGGSTNAHSFFNTGGNVGIGTTTPGALLDVNGSMRLSNITTNTNGVLYITDANGTLGATATGSTGTLCLVSTNGGAPLFSSCAGSASTSWSALSNPSGNTSLSMSTNLTTFNWATGTSTNNMFSLTSDNSANGTGALLNVQTGTSSTVSPVRVRAGATEAVSVDASGNVGVGTTAPTEKLDVEGNIQLGAQPNTAFASQVFTQVSGTAGTIGGGATTNIASVSASAVYNGSLYVGTYDDPAGGAEVYRYDGTSTTWTKVSQGTAGTIMSGGTTNIGSVSAMTVFDGSLYVGTSKMNAAEVYRYDGGTTWVKVSAPTTGTIAVGGTALIDGVSALAVYQGQLILGTRENAKAEAYKYNGGSSWTKISNGTAGTFVATNTINVNAVTSFAVNNGILYAGLAKPGDADTIKYTGGITWITVNAAGTTGSYTINNAAVTAYNESIVTSYKGSLIIGLQKLNAADVVQAIDSGVAVTNVFNRLNNAPGMMTIGGTSSIDGIASLNVYNGFLYIGTAETNNAEVYRYIGDEKRFIRVSNAGGQLASGGTTGIAAITTMANVQDLMYVGTQNSLKAEVYSYEANLTRSYALKFNAASQVAGGELNGQLSEASLYFMASASANLGSTAGNTGALISTHGIQTRSASYDVAEDYPTRDDSLEPGDLVAIDTHERGFVRKSAKKADSGVIGVYSENPALRLTQQQDTINGGRAIPVALAGRVEVKVSTEAGSIKTGDHLSASSIPGVAMKAVKQGEVFGKALSSFDGQGIGKVMVFVNMSYVDNATILASMTFDSEEETLSEDGMSFLKTEAGLMFLKESATAYDDVQDIAIQDLQGKYATLSARIETLEQKLISSPSATVIESSSYVLGASTAAILDPYDLFGHKDATVSGKLAVSGRALFNDVGITGDITAGLLRVRGLDGEISTLGGPLKLQADALGGLEFVGGAVSIDKKGNIVTAASVTAQKLHITKDSLDSSADSIGEGIIKKGQTKAIIETTAVTKNSYILVTPKTLGVSSLVVTEQKEATSFLVEMEQSIQKDVKFNWWIVN